MRMEINTKAGHQDLMNGFLCEVRKLENSILMPSQRLGEEQDCMKKL